MYKFYCYDALMKQDAKTIFNERFGISDTTYEKVLMGTECNELTFGLITKRNKYDVCHETKISEKYKNYPAELRIAIDYEAGYHPDDLCFVTCDKIMAETANTYFGEDSIQLIKD